jgi:hypothetical protein
MQVAQALGPVAIAVAALAVTGFFAWRQWKIQYDRLRFDLFDKRYSYFAAVRKFLISIYSRGDLDYGALDVFDREIVGHEFVFDDEVVSFIDAIRRSALHLRTLHANLEGLPVGTERSEKAAAIETETRFLLSQHREMMRVFARTMKFR